MIQCTFAFVVAAHAHVVGACPSYGINLVDEYDARCFLFGLAEEVAHAAGAHAYEHLHKVAARHGEEWYVGFAGYGFGQQGFTCSRRSDKQSSFGNFTAQIGVFFRIFQERYYLFDFLFGAGQSGYVLECYFGFAFIVFVEQLRFRFAYAENASGAVAHASCHQDEK